MAAIDVEGAAQGVSELVQGFLLRGVRVVVFGLCAGTAGTLGKAGNGCGSEQVAILKG